MRVEFIGCPVGEYPCPTTAKKCTKKRDHVQSCCFLAVLVAVTVFVAKAPYYKGWNLVHIDSFVLSFLNFSTTLQPPSRYGIWKNSERTNHIFVRLQRSVHCAKWTTQQALLLDR